MSPLIHGVIPEFTPQILNANDFAHPIPETCLILFLLNTLINAGVDLPDQVGRGVIEVSAEERFAGLPDIDSETFEYRDVL